MTDKTLRVLSTRKLSPSQRELLLNSGVSVVEADLIRTQPVKTILPERVSNAIFTSQNAVAAIAESKPQIDRCFCVGDKTEAALTALGYTIAEKAYQADKLAQILIDGYARESFTFFCGSLRRESLPLMLREQGMELNEIQVYQTLVNPQHLGNAFDGVLFFSPSAVESFAERNIFGDFVSFAIGKTTEAALKKYTNNIITANKSSIENVIVQVVKHFAIL